VSLWLKMIGAHDFELSTRPFEDEFRDELYTHVRFPRDKFPHQITVGDELVYYAVGHYRIFAVSRITGDVRRDVPHPNVRVFKRWPHAAAIDLGPHIKDLALAPFLEDVSPAHKAEIHQGISYLPMGRPEYDRAVAAIRKAQAAEELREKRMARAGAP
jgi:hypothetical protein